MALRRSLAALQTELVGQRAQHLAGLDFTAEQRAADARWKELQAAQLPLVARPQPLVRLVAVEHVELGEAVFDRRLDGERHQHQADAEFRKGVAEAVLIEIEVSLPYEA